MPISNAEKQARYRKKEQLDKHVSQTYRDCLGSASLPVSRSPSFGNFEAALREAASLPSGWTDEDLDRAYRRIYNLRGDVLGARDPLGNDLHEGRNFSEEFKRTPNPKKLMDDFKQAETDTRALAGHLVSAMELSRLPNEDRAAALMEAMRHTGRALASSDSDGQSDAMAICWAVVNPHYQRPDWFVERLSKWLRGSLDDDTRRALGQSLLEDRGGPLWADRR